MLVFGFHRVFSGLYLILTGLERRAILKLFVLVLVVSIVETIGIAAVMPLISIVADPNIVFENPYLFERVEEYLT